MTNNEKYEILNKQLLKQYDYIDKLPKKLYKYREFNEYNYDSLINNYIYLSKASKLDDETECDTIFDPNRYFDLIKGALEKEVINIILLALKDAIIEHSLSNVIFKIIDKISLIESLAIILKTEEV